MQKALLIAEKPDLKRKIEAVYDAHRGEIPYDATFMAQRGHLLTLKLPFEVDEDMKEWSWDHLPYAPEDHGGWQYKVREDKKVGNYPTSRELYEGIKKELKSGKYDFVIHAGDPDQEGELLVNMVLIMAGNRLPVKRFWTNDVTEEKILDALVNLRDDRNDPMLKNLLKAAYGRQHSDYRFGMNISEAASMKMGARVACGRVKTPILAIVCRREKEIEGFTPKTVYGVRADFTEGFPGVLWRPSEDAGGEDDDGREDAGTVWFDTKDEAEKLMRSLPDSGTVASYEKKRVKTLPPKLFKLATAQVAVGKYGMSSSETLATIQGLYEKGYLSYPRTDCEYVSSHENFDAMLRSAGSVPELAGYVKSITGADIMRFKNTKKWVNDKALEDSGHSALVPTTKAPKHEELSQQERLVYGMVCRQFVAAFLPPLVQDKVTLVTGIGDETFRSSGKTLVDPGYSKVYGTRFTDAVIPEHSEGDRLAVDGFDTTEKTSTCPKRFTDPELIAVCENPAKYLDDKSLKSLGKRLSIGTPATRAGIIKTLIDKDRYVMRTKEGKKEYLKPTVTGMEIYENMKDLKICKVDMTGEWEEKLELVRKGELGLPELEEYMKEGVSDMVSEIRDSSEMKSVGTGRKVIGKCPECGGDIISGPRSFYCSNYKTGCKCGAFKKVCDTEISDEDFAKMLGGERVTVSLKKGKSRWNQTLVYDGSEHKIKFVEREAEESRYACPSCGSRLTDDGRCISCSCGFKFWKSPMQGARDFTEEEIDRFFNEGTTGLIRGLRGKSGKKFDAEIVLSEDKKGTRFRFPERTGADGEGDGGRGGSRGRGYGYNGHSGGKYGKSTKNSTRRVSSMSRKWPEAPSGKWPESDG